MRDLPSERRRIWSSILFVWLLLWMMTVMVELFARALGGVVFGCFLDFPNSNSHNIDSFIEIVSLRMPMEQVRSACASAAALDT